MYIHDTGWSKVTVTSNFSLASLKITKNVNTQPFLESLYATILIFQCLSMIRWQKLCLSGLCLISAFAPYCKDWETNIPPKHIPAPSFFINTIQISPRHFPDIPQTPPDLSREHDIPTDDNRCQGTDARHSQTASVCVLGCLVVSVCGCWCLLVCCVPWRCHGVVSGVSEGYLSGIHRNWRHSDVFWEYVGYQLR